MSGNNYLLKYSIVLEGHISFTFISHWLVTWKVELTRFPVDVYFVRTVTGQYLADIQLFNLESESSDLKYEKKNIEKITCKDF